MEGRGEMGRNGREKGRNERMKGEGEELRRGEGEMTG